jgi:hypothetical protein
MEGVTIIVRTIERGWHLALALIVVSGSVIAAHRLGLPELAFFRGWIEWATIGLGWGISIALFGTVARIVRRVHSGSTSSRTRREKANASREQAEAEFCKLELARQNLATLSREERALLMDALKRHPFHVEVLELGPCQSLIRKEILCIVGEGGDTTLVCKVHPWLALHRNELTGIIGFDQEM